ncbi:MAG: Rne/Rng family ribonuclease [Desulfovibrio sp.]|jgi:ribonuclease E|nr:Rne/Rng family ribonuclease [Desulfovibrio sp.]
MNDVVKDETISPDTPTSISLNSEESPAPKRKRAASSRSKKSLQTAPLEEETTAQPTRNSRRDASRNSSSDAALNSAQDDGQKEKKSTRGGRSKKSSTKIPEQENGQSTQVLEDNTPAPSASTPPVEADEETQKPAKNSRTSPRTRHSAAASSRRPARGGKKSPTAESENKNQDETEQTSPAPGAEQIKLAEDETEQTSPETGVEMIKLAEDETEQTSLETGVELIKLAEDETTALENGTEQKILAEDENGQTALAGDESSPESVAADEENATSAGRKRKRSRRGGRGRRKNGRSAPAAENGAENAPDEEAAPAVETKSASEPDLASSTQRGREDNAPETVRADKNPDDEAESEDGKKSGSRKMYVSVLPGEQVEVVITEHGQVQEYYVEMLHQAKTKGNIYKGVVNNVDQNLQAAFVSYGANKNGFLQIDEIHPEYYVAPHENGRGKKYPAIQKVLKAGQEMLVQVVKEPSGSKGAFLTTYLSMPGRFLVLTPGREQIGVSRKVEDEGERTRLRGLLEGLNPGPGLGVIVRTVSMGASKTNLQRDLQFLKRTWKDVRTRGTTEKSPCMVYQEMDLTARAVRDYLNESIGEIRIDDEETAASVTEVGEALFPRRKNLVRVYKDTSTSLFDRYNIQRQLDQIHSREVTLPSGGRLVIDPTEALTAIDINSGRSGGKGNFEDLAYRTNMEAALMIPLQLRLRDIGGQIVADFIEMRDKNHWREVEKTLRNAMKVDRARYDVGKISSFGLLEIVRQRLGSSAISISTETCPHCKGSGLRRNMEWQSQHALREIQRLMRAAQSRNEAGTEFAMEKDLALHLLNNKRQRLAEMERELGVTLEIKIKAAETGAATNNL